MTTKGTSSDYWALTSPELGARMRGIANADSSQFSDSTRGEAALLAEECFEALNLPIETFEEQSTRRVRLAALQRRSIEILVREFGPDEPSGAGFDARDAA